jgi:hypothetical protein
MNDLDKLLGNDTFPLFPLKPTPAYDFPTTKPLTENEEKVLSRISQSTASSKSRVNP